MKQALEELLRMPDPGTHPTRHPFIGGDKGDGSDVSGNIKAALRARFRRRSTFRLRKGKGFELVKWFDR